MGKIVIKKKSTNIGEKRERKRGERVYQNAASHQRAEPRKRKRFVFFSRFQQFLCVHFSLSLTERLTQPKTERETTQHKPLIGSNGWDSISLFCFRFIYFLLFFFFLRWDFLGSFSVYFNAILAYLFSCSCFSYIMINKRN